MIDSSFFGLYTGQPKPPVLGDLAGSERGLDASEFTAPCSTSREPEAAPVVWREGAASPDSSPFLIHRGTAASLRNMMGVFPLADTMSFVSNPPLSCGGNPRAPFNGRTDEVWWHPHPRTNPRRNAAAAHSPIITLPVHTPSPGAPAPTRRLASRTPDGTSGATRPFVYQIGPMDRPPSAGRPSATSRMPALHDIRHACGTRARLPLPQSSVFAAGGTRMQ